MITDAIEAGARATDALVEIGWSAIVGHDIAANCHNASITRGDLKTALLAAIASGDLVPASAVAAERERCAALIEAECERVLSKQTPDADPLSVNEAINSNLRMVAVLLPDLAAAIRALSPEPASGEFVVVPREPTDHMVRCGEDGGRKAVGVELSQEGGRKFADAAYRAMLNAATKDGSGS